MKRTTVKKILKYTLFAIIVIALMPFMVLGIGRFYDWRIQKSEERVRQSIQKNYKKHPAHFAELIDFTKKLPVNFSIEFSGNNKLYFTLSTKEYDSQEDGINSWYIQTFEDDELYNAQFEFIEGGQVTVHSLDSIYEFENWYWTFEGSFEHKEFEKFTEYTQLTKGDLMELKALLEKIDCEAIDIGIDSSIRLRYEGISWYQYEYMITQNEFEIPKDYIKLDEGVYCGLFDSGLYCTQYMFSK